MKPRSPLPDLITQFLAESDASVAITLLAEIATHSNQLDTISIKTLIALYTCQRSYTHSLFADNCFCDDDTLESRTPTGCIEKAFVILHPDRQLALLLEMIEHMDPFLGARLCSLLKISLPYDPDLFRNLPITRNPAQMLRRRLRMLADAIAFQSIADDGK